MKSTNNTRFRSQNPVVMTLPADCVALNFRGLGEEECRHSRDCCLASGVMWNAQLSSPVTIESKMSYFRLRSAEEIRVRTQCVTVGGLL